MSNFQDTACCFCNKREPTSDLTYDLETDTYVHINCIRTSLKENPKNPNALALLHLVVADNNGNL
jgi:hypothetical protein